MPDKKALEEIFGNTHPLVSGDADTQFEFLKHARKIMYEGTPAESAQFLSADFASALITLADNRRSEVRIRGTALQVLDCLIVKKPEAVNQDMLVRLQEMTGEFGIPDLRKHTSLVAVAKSLNTVLCSFGMFRPDLGPHRDPASLMRGFAPEQNLKP